MPSVFLSHSSDDKSFVKILANKFQMAGVSTWLDEAEIDVGDSLIKKISEGIFHTDLVVAVLSPNSIESNWVQKELQLAMTKEIHGKRVIVLPIVIEKCDIPFFLRDKVYADFTDLKKFDYEFSKLIRSIHRRAMPDNKIDLDVPFYKKPTSDSLIQDSTTAKRIGDVDVGAVIHERGSDYYGFRNTRQSTLLGWLIMASGVLIMIMGFVLRIRTGKMRHLFGLLIPGFIFYVAGSTLKLSMSLRRRAYDYDKKLLLIDEEEKIFDIPFGSFWRKRLQLGGYNKLYRFSIIIEAIAFMLFLIDILIFVVMMRITVWQC